VSPRTPSAPAPLPDLLRDLPDVRDGLTRPERAVLVALHEAQQEFPGRHVPTALLYGRVVEREGMSVEEFQRILARLAGGAPRAPSAFERGRRR
jgi:hypothetical protein